MANQILFKPTPENYQGLTDARATDDLCVTDHEGLLRAIPPGELPFEKARVVKNLLADVSGAGSEDLNTATATGTVNSATTWTPSATGNAVYFDVTTAASEEYVVSFKLKVVSGTNYTPSIYHNNSATGNTTSITATGTQQRFSVKVSGRTGGGAVSFGIYEGHATPGGTYTITEFQVENVTGQTNQNPSEYVSVNVGDGTELLATHDYTDWAPELNNTCTDGGDGSVLITAVDSSNGAKLDLGALSPDLETSNIDYVVTYEAKVNSGSSVNVILNNETPAYSQEVTSTSYTSYIAYIQYDGSGDFTMQTTGMTTGVEIINVRNVSVQKATTGFAQYSTANGNTVNATTKVVTEATGAALSPVPYLRHVPAATNLVPEATNLSNWTNDGNGGTTLTANAGISPFGAYDAFEVAQIDSIFDFIREEIGVLATSTEHTCSLLIKNVDSTLTRWIAGYNISDGSNPYIDITWTGAVPSISGKDTSVSGDTVYALDNDWYLITLQFTTSITSSGHRLQIYPEFSATATNSILFGGCQLEASSFATPLIETTGASASRNATAIQTPLNTGAGGNFNQTEGALEITYVPEQDVNDLTAVMSVLDIGGTNAVLSHASGGAIQAKDGTNTADTPAAVHDAGDKITAGVAWDTTGNSLRVGYKNVTDATSWVWDADSANYDGGFDTSSGNIELFNGATNIYQIHSLVVQDAVATTAEIEAGLPVAGGGQYQLGLVTDTEATFAVSQSKDKTLGLLADTESVFSLSSTKTRDLGLLSDAEAVFALTSEKHYDLGLISDTESVFGIDSVKTQELGLVSDSEAVLSLNWDAVTTLGLVADTETVYPIDNPGIIVLGLVVDTESVLSVSQQKESTLNLVTDTESVLPVSSGTAQTLGLVTDTEQVFSVSQEKQQTVGLVTDTESVLSVTGVSVRELGIITDSEISYPVDKIKWQQLGLVTSLETVFTLQGQQLIGLGAINDPAIYSMTTRKRIHSMTPERCVVGMG